MVELGPGDDIYHEDSQLLMESQTKLLEFYNEWFEDNPRVVAICVPTAYGQVHIWTALSFMSMIKPEKIYFHSLIGLHLSAIRNLLIRQALKDSDVTHVLFIDGDCIPPIWGLARLLRRNVDVISGFTMQREPPFSHSIIQNKGGYNYFPNFDDTMLNRMIPVDRSGAFFLLIKREVFERLPKPWFNVYLFDDGFTGVGEDIYFYDKCKQYQIQPFVDTSVVCEHASGNMSYPGAFRQGIIQIGPKSKAQIQQYNKTALQKEKSSEGQIYYDKLVGQFREASE